MTMKRLRDGIYADTDGTNGGNYGAIILDNEILMVDAGMIHTKSLASREFLDTEIGLPIKKMLLTHSHSDHVFGVQSFEPILLISSILTRNQCHQNLNTDWNQTKLLERYSEVKDQRPELWAALQTLKIHLPDIAFNDEVVIGEMKQVRAKLVGGHTAGSSIVMSQDHSTIFVGDLIFNGQFPYGGDPSCNPDRWIQALNEISSLEFDTVVPGHGSICSKSDLIKYSDALTQLKQNVTDAVSGGISVEAFVEQNLIPKSLKEGFERFGEVTLKHWFEYYS
jgi:cyclase